MKSLQYCNLIFLWGIVIFFTQLNSAKSENSPYFGFMKALAEKHKNGISKENIENPVLKQQENSDDDIAENIEKVPMEDVDGSNVNDDEDANPTLNVCGEEDSEKYCTCKNESLVCFRLRIDGKKLHHANVKVMKPGFIVKSANFKHNTITSLRKGQVILHNAHSVKTLLLNYNIIKTVESNVFDEFHSLEVLNLDHNLIPAIDETILTKKVGSTLKELYLNKNKLTSISPETFMYMKNLKILHIAQNAFVKVDQSMFPKYLENLEDLHIGFCHITSFDDDVFVNLKNLQNILLVGNPITSIPIALNFLPNLLTLDLSATKITDLKTQEMHVENKVREIYMMDIDTLTTIGDCAFCGLPNLKTLFVSGGQFTTIHENAFGGITSDKTFQMKSLTILYTKLTVLPEKLLDWKSLTLMTIDNNKFECDCSMAWLINDLSEYEIDRIPKCASPPELANISFTDVSGKICKNFFVNSSSMFWPSILLITVLIAVVAFLCYTRHPRRRFRQPDLSQMTYRNLSAQQQHHDDEEEEELQAHF